MITVNCKICKNVTLLFGRAKVLDKYDVAYFRCPHCGLIETESPYWLDHAYNSPIAKSDIGLLSRNIKDAKVTERVISQLFNADGRFLDYGGGYGVFTRLLRDSGFDFYRYDTYCPNLFAQGLDGSLSGEYELVTAFEVFEHLVDPVTDLRSIIGCSRNILFTTALVPDPPPPLGNWWYYALEGGQHVTLYTRTALSLLADTVGLKYVNCDNLHLFTERDIAPGSFQDVARGFRKYWIFSELFERTPSRRSLIETDYKSVIIGQSTSVSPASCEISKVP